MDLIDILMREHENVLRLCSVIRTACCKILDGERVCESDFRDMISFARSYADKFHHGKEEEILFREMTANLGKVAVNLINHGMLVEHDMGRFYLKQLEAALNAHEAEPTVENRLDIIMNAAAWADLLKRHAEKEDAAVYSFARRALPEEIQASIAAEIGAFQAAHEAEADAMLCLLAQLEAKYN